MIRRPLDFARINVAALPALPALCARWLPGGKRVGREYIALNPTRADKRAGSFKVNLQTGRWADFATGDKGSDAVFHEELSEEFVSRRLVGQRLATMATNGFLIHRGDGYALSPKGRLTATAFSWIKRFWGLGAGG
jgi:hypothetical protein